MNRATLAVCVLAVLLAGCDMPQVSDPNSLRARVLGTPQTGQTTQVQPVPQIAQVTPTVEPTTPPQPTATAIATAQPVQPAQMAGALADAPMVDPNGADPYEVAQALAIAVGGVIGFYLFAVWTYTRITRRGRA